SLFSGFKRVFTRRGWSPDIRILCAISVSLWLMIDNFHHRVTENTEIAQRGPVRLKGNKIAEKNWEELIYATAGVTLPALSVKRKKGFDETTLEITDMFLADGFVSLRRTGAPLSPRL
ncbi:MAG TPA: hypothetical protein VEV81_16105, partial [Pyrinomonadaceae bacterium]|nr:hypothetical protein [Pyrinomonadaceae bacterium]